MIGVARMLVGLGLGLAVSSPALAQHATGAGPAIQILIQQTSDQIPVGKVTLVGAGLGAAFGFLVGAASPRYRWVRTDTE